ncbi:hypothetical protein N7G274_010538 [Stereocaulon virgatum]|uniref:BTB domain-containing protein n=1 Tax=Stereocaulon virgatum TaxID=373712 RepID=A0ABR4A091_9LECA
MVPKMDAEMPAEAQNIYASTPFKFIIDGKPLYIHAALVSRNSKPLGRLINGPMAEAQQGFAVIDDVDEGTFVRFIQWAYNGYYDAAKHENDPMLRSPSTRSEKAAEEPLEIEAPVSEVWEEQPVLAQEPLPQPDQDDWNAFGRARKSSKMSERDSYASLSAHDQKSTMRSLGQDLKESFIKRKEAVRNHSISPTQPRENQALEEDYTEVFLSHARLYVFADKYDIQPLKTLALEELQAMLKIFNLHLERTGDIIALLRFVYANTGEPDGGVEDMRAMLTHYIGFEMDTLMKDDGFRDLMIEDGGALLGDFMTMVGKRIR